MRETPAKIVLSWGALFAVAWFVNAHVALVAGIAVGGCVACLAVWAVVRLWRQGAETDRCLCDEWPEDPERLVDLRRLPVREPNGRRVLPRHARSRREPSLLDPESDEWFVDAAGMIVDDTGRRV